MALGALCVPAATFVSNAAEGTAGCQPRPGDVHMASARFEVVARAESAPIALGRHFALDIAVCPRSGVSAPTRVRVDASMPAHRHGMNYRVSVKPLPANGGSINYRAEGLMFHMAGRWELVLEVHADGRSDRLSQGITIE